MRRSRNRQCAEEVSWGRGDEKDWGDLSSRPSENGAIDGLWSLYVHVPFCVRKCPYCAFPSAPMAEPRDGDRYLDTVAREIAFWRQRWGRLPVLDTIYIGGGTPTVLSPPMWERLMGLLSSNFAWTPQTEITVEANPGTLRKGHLELWRRWGVTRVSVGVQSLDDGELALLERLHSAAQARDALAACSAAGFATSADLLFGLPHQTLALWHRHLRELLALGVKHLSVYQLTLEPDTPWGDHPPEGLKEGYPFYRFAQWYLPRKGFAQYEVASFAPPGYRARHNFAYWKHLPVLGLGPGAWSYMQGWRFRHEKTLLSYEKSLESGAALVVEEECLPRSQRWREFALLALRTGQGIGLRAFRRTFGQESFSEMIRVVMPFFPELLTARSGHLCLTPRGWRVANRVWGALWNGNA